MPTDFSDYKQVDLHLLGIYEANGHLSIRNYYDYCIAELPPCLPGWVINSSKPGRNRQDFVPGNRVDRRQSWFENYVDWPLKLRSLHSGIFHIIDQGIAWYRSFLTTGKTVVTVNDLINVMILNGHLNFGEFPAFTD